MGNKFDRNTRECGKCGYISEHYQSGYTQRPRCGKKSHNENDATENYNNPPFNLLKLDVKRPTFEQVYMSLAKILSSRSTCSRRKVGCVITSHDYKKVFSVGYNGNASKLPNKCDKPNESGECGCLHAEENAIISCSEPPYVPKIIFTTVYPCKMCAKRIIQLGGVLHVFYLDDYHNREAKLLFDELDIMISPVNIDNLFSRNETP
jgi:deoxycytidylate deaminase